MNLAARGAREGAAGIEAVADAAERAALRRRAVTIAAQSVFVAVLVTLLAFLGRPG